MARLRTVLLNRRQFRAVVILFLLVALVSCSPPATTAEVVEIASVDDLAGPFNQADVSAPKLILLLSPT